MKMNQIRTRILGPLLFLIQINDLVKMVDGCRIKMYADDTVIYTSHRDIKVIEKHPID